MPVAQVEMMMVQLVWADVNPIENLSRHPIIRVAGFILPAAVENVFISNFKSQIVEETKIALKGV